MIGILPILASMFLIPRDLEFAERLAEDGQPNRAIALVKELLPQEIDRPVDGEDGTWELPAMEGLLSGSDGQRIRGGKKTRMLRILLQVSDDPEGVFGLLENYSHSLSPDVAKDFYAMTATTALGQNNPGLAARIYLALDHLHGLDDNLMMKAIMACRFSGSPKPALDLIYDHAKNEGLTVSELPRNLRMLLIAMHRELNEGTKAFALLKGEFDRSKTEQQRTELIEALATTASQSNLFSESLPLLRDFIGKTQANLLSWEILAARNEPHPSDESFLKYGTILAQQFLWSGELDSALDLYRKLALLSSDDALDKCVMIAPWVDRTSDLGLLLASLDSLPAGKGYEKLLFEYYGEEGKFDQAENLLKKLIAEGTGEQNELLQSLAELVFELGRYEEAKSIYQKVYEARLKEPSIKELDSTMAGLARCAAITGDYKKALELYRGIPLEQHDTKSLGDYHYLAVSLNSASDNLRILKFQLDQPHHQKEPHAYLEFADACENEGILDKAQETLAKGLEACPDSRKLVLRSSEIMTKRGMYHEALEFLYQHYNREDVRFHYQILDLAITTQRQSEVLKFLNLKDPLGKNWPTTLRLALAEVYESKLEYKLALEIYNNLNPDGYKAPKARLMAQIAYDNGKIKEAWALQSSYLSMTPNPSPDDLVFMGDLHRFTGRTSDAAIAYNAALQNINRSISQDVATKPAAPPSPL